MVINTMFVSKNALLSIFALFSTLLLGTFLLPLCINKTYDESSPILLKRRSLLMGIPLASPAIVSAGRNIAFETGNVMANAPASYLTMLDCCESDEAIASRILIGSLQGKVVKKYR